MISLQSTIHYKGKETGTFQGSAMQHSGSCCSCSNRTQGYFLSSKNAIFDLGWGKDLNTSPGLFLNLRSSSINLEFEPPSLVNCTLFFFLYEAVFVCIIGDGYTGVEPGLCECQATSYIQLHPSLNSFTLNSSDFTNLIRNL